MAHQGYGNEKQDERDGNNAKRSLHAPRVRAVEPEIAGQRFVPFARRENNEAAGETKKARVAFLAAIGGEEEQSHQEAFLEPAAHGGSDSIRTALGAFHTVRNLSCEFASAQGYFA